MNSREFDIKFWVKKLNRRLKKYECIIINEAYCENEMNESILNIGKFAKNDNLYIPILTPDDGNCLFHSLCYHGLASSVDILKKGIANIMIFFKNLKNFIPGQDLSLDELFGFYNEIEFVFCRNTQKLYKYNYDIMCMDFLTKRGWRRMNTELLLTIMSISLNIKFNIYHDNEHITYICPNKKENTREIYLGQIGECHYIPLDEIKNDQHDEQYKIPLCDKDINTFSFWKKIVEIKNEDENEDGVLSENDFFELYNNSLYDNYEDDDYVI
jgi:hypothetical protein